MAPSPEIASPFPRDTASCTTPVTSPALSARHLQIQPPQLRFLSILSILSILLQTNFHFGKTLFTVVVEGLKDKKSTSAKPMGDSYTSHPEQDLQTRDPSFVGGVPPEAKKTMAEKVKGLFKGHHRDDEEDIDSATGSGVGHTAEASPHGTVDAGNDSSGNAMDPTAAGKEETNVQPQGATGSDVLTDQHGNLKPGPHTDNVKRDTVFSKIKDKLHSSK